MGVVKPSASERSKGPAKNDEYTILNRRLAVAKDYIQGMSQVEIAAKYGVSQPTISLDLKAIRDGWTASAILDWDEAKTKELAALDLQELELWRAWQRSCQVEVVKTSAVEKEFRAVTEGKDKKVVGAEMVPVKRTGKKVERQLIGDPRYMAEITKIRELRCKILGFLKDEKATQQVNINVINWEQVQGIRGQPDPVETRIQQLTQGTTDVVSQPQGGTDGQEKAADGGGSEG